MDALVSSKLIHFLKAKNSAIAVTVGVGPDGKTKKVVTTNDPQVYKALLAAKERGLLASDEHLVGPPVANPTTPGKNVHAEVQGIQHLQGEGFAHGVTGTTPAGCHTCQNWMQQNAPGYQHQNPKPGGTLEPGGTK